MNAEIYEQIKQFKVLPGTVIDPEKYVISADFEGSGAPVPLAWTWNPTLIGDNEGGWELDDYYKSLGKQLAVYAVPKEHPDHFKHGLPSWLTKGKPQ